MFARPIILASVFLSCSVSEAAPSIAGVLNGATFKAGGVAPGTLVSIFGSGFANSTIVAATVPLPTSLAGTTVSINGILAPLLFASTGQINAQVPYGIAQGNAALVVRDASGVVANSTLQIVAAAPGIFTKTLDGKGEAIATHSDYKLVNRVSGQYAQIGETIIIYCTGLGEVNGSSVAGSPALASPLPSTRQTVEVLMDGKPARVVYSGLTPGSIGLYQINAVVPGEIGGDVIVSVRVGSSVSNNSTINVAGVFSLASNYTGTLTARTGNDRFQLDFISLTATTTSGIFTGSYAVSQSGKALDSGSLQFRTSATAFTLTAKSVDGTTLYALMDTLNAGDSFIGILLNDPQVPDSWYASFEVFRKAPMPPSGGTSTGLQGGSFSCAVVEGASIFTHDGKYLGKITSNRFDQDSIGNQFGSYGSTFSASSIFNMFGDYGSQFSSTSAFNQFATTPPVIVVNGRPQWYLTINTTKPPGIFPTQLYPCIGKQ